MNQTLMCGVIVRRTSLSAADKKWLKKLGLRIESLIKAKGYKSQYAFWIHSGIGDCISRSTLNAIINGHYDVKVTTLKILAKQLGTTVDSLLKF
ncbi:MAG: helix-turn-helix transcriptional regulator [Oligoflexia bacterium]|nr:helix-turn-helix transcriptional regulator [Oligoflexia bacterium]